tara:strand:+ start:1388 stop:1915 length:528 start_codon:yes stop_codon:yes gene_type:complete
MANSATYGDTADMQSTGPLTEFPDNRLVTLNLKDTNPKDSVGIKKPRFYTGLPMNVLRRVTIAFLEGALKYGRHNYRVVGVRASVYVDAAQGHLLDYWEGQDIDPDSGLHHIDKAIASLFVLRDAQLRSMCTDDRPPKSNVEDDKAEMQIIVDALFKKYPNPVTAYIEGDVKLHD